MVISGAALAEKEAAPGRRSRTRDRLVAAAERLFAERGADAVSIDEIVAAADVAKGTFYNHFTDKTELARVIARTVRAEIEAEVAAANRGVADAAARVARAVSIFSRFAFRNPVRVRATLFFFESGTDPEAPLNGGVRADVVAGLRSGRFEAENRDDAIVFVIGVAQAAVQRAMAARTAAIAARGTQSLATLLLRGLGLGKTAAQSVASDAAAAVFENSSGGIS